jgi:hypothetical protein
LFQIYLQQGALLRTSQPGAADHQQATAGQGSLSTFAAQLNKELIDQEKVAPSEGLL